MDFIARWLLIRKLESSTQAVRLWTARSAVHFGQSQSRDARVQPRDLGKSDRTLFRIPRTSQSARTRAVASIRGISSSSLLAV